MSTPSSKYGPGRSVPPLSFIKTHLTASIPAPDANLQGRVALVTGATAGLGYEAALHFARLNISTLIFAVRNPKKAETAERQLYKDVPSFRGQVKVIKLDYDSFESVRLFVREVDSSVDRLDFALLNAGVTNQTYQATPDGWVQDIQVNVLSTGLLAALLLPKLSATAKLPLPEKVSHPNLKPQLHIVSSEVHYWVVEKTITQLTSAKPLLDLLNSPEFFDSLPFGEMYNITKLLDVFIGRKIGALAAAEGVQVTSSSPGLCKSGFRDGFGAFAAWLMNLIAWNPSFGTRNYFAAMLQPHPQGTFVFAGLESPPSVFACSEDGVAVEDVFWREASSVWIKAAPEVEKILSA